MRRMSGTGNHHHFDRTIAFFLRDLDLTDGPVLIVGALQGRERYPDVGEILRNIPATKPVVEPRVIPTVEGVVDIAVPALQLLPEASGLIGLPGLRDRRQPDIFHDEMRRDHRHRADAMILDTNGIDRRNRSAVGMPEHQAAATADIYK